MNDKELADKVVALGVQFNGPMKPEAFVRDWRVAGALMEKVPTVEIAQLVNSQGYAAQAADDDCLYIEIRNESAPRAIIEACVEALKGQDE